jgi:hypothetical protein
MVKKYSPALKILILLALILPLAGIAYQGTLTRFHGDDFCMAADAGQLGLGNMLAKWYASWTGRYSFILGTGALGLGGPGLAGLLPGVVMAGWLVLLAWAALPLLRKANFSHPGWLASGGAALALLTLFSSTPNLFQSLLWQDGMVNYTLPLVGLTALAGTVARAWTAVGSTRLAAGAAFGLALVSGGFTESFAAMQAVLFGLLLAGLLLMDRATRRRMLPVAGAALLGAALAMILVAAAPGNQIRQAAVGERPGVARIVTFSARNAAYIAGKFALQHPGWAALALGAPFLAAWLFGGNPPQKHGREGEEERIAANRPRFGEGAQATGFLGLLAIPVGTFGLLAAACAPVVFALNAYPDERTILVPQFALVLAVMAWGALLSRALRRWGRLPALAQGSNQRLLAALALLSMLAAAGASSAWRTAGLLPEEQAYTQRWDARAAQIDTARASGQAEITLPGLENRHGVPDLGAQPDFWVNRCMAAYYGFVSIYGK